MSNKTDLQANNLVLGTAPAGLLGGLNNVKDALEDKGITVTQSGTNPTFTELVDAIDDASIPDVSATTATASDVAQGKVFINAQGVETTGTGEIVSELGGFAEVEMPASYEKDKTFYSLFSTQQGDMFLVTNSNAYLPSYYLNKGIMQWETILNGAIGLPRFKVFNNGDILFFNTSIGNAIRPQLFKNENKSFSVVDVVNEDGEPISISGTTISTWYSDKDENVYGFSSAYCYVYIRSENVIKQIGMTRQLDSPTIYECDMGVFVFNYGTNSQNRPVYKINLSTKSLDLVFDIGTTIKYFSKMQYIPNVGLVYFASSYNLNRGQSAHYGAAFMGINDSAFSLINENDILDSVDQTFMSSDGHFFVSSSGYNRTSNEHYGLIGLWYFDPSQREFVQLLSDGYYFLGSEDSLSNIFLYTSQIADGVFLFDKSTKTASMCLSAATGSRLSSPQIYRTEHYTFLTSYSSSPKRVYTFDNETKKFILSLEGKIYMGLVVIENEFGVFLSGTSGSAGYGLYKMNEDTLIFDTTLNTSNYDYCCVIPDSKDYCLFVSVYSGFFKYDGSSFTSIAPSGSFSGSDSGFNMKNIRKIETEDGIFIYFDSNLQRAIYFYNGSKSYMSTTTQTGPFGTSSLTNQLVLEGDNVKLLPYGPQAKRAKIFNPKTLSFVEDDNAQYDIYSQNLKYKGYMVTGDGYSRSLLIKGNLSKKLKGVYNSSNAFVYVEQPSNISPSSFYHYAPTYLNIADSFESSTPTHSLLLVFTEE